MSETFKGHYRRQEAQILQECYGVWVAESQRHIQDFVGEKNNFWGDNGLAQGVG